MYEGVWLCGGEAISGAPTLTLSVATLSSASLARCGVIWGFISSDFSFALPHSPHSLVRGATAATVVCSFDVFAWSSTFRVLLLPSPAPGFHLASHLLGAIYLPRMMLSPLQVLSAYPF